MMELLSNKILSLTFSIFIFPPSIIHSILRMLTMLHFFFKSAHTRAQVHCTFPFFSQFSNILPVTGWWSSCRWWRHSRRPNNNNNNTQCVVTVFVCVTTPLTDLLFLEVSSGVSKTPTKKRYFSFRGRTFFRGMFLRIPALRKFVCVRTHVIVCLIEGDQLNTYFYSSDSWDGQLLDFIVVCVYLAAKV